MAITLYIGCILAAIAVIIAVVCGWIFNIVALVHLAGVEPFHITGMFIIRCIGIFVAPLGAILGYC